MSFRYHPIKRWSKKLYRKLNPVPESPWTEGEVDDICKIHLVPPEKLKTFFTDCIKTLQKIKGKDVGDYLEFGVFNGSSIGSAYLAAKKMKVGSMRFLGFDAFKGLPSETNKEHDILKKGFYACSFKKMEECLKRRRIDSTSFIWVKGWYDKTLNAKTAKKYKITNPGIVFIDCDTYSSSRAVLKFIAPLIKNPLIICLDDWKLYDMDIKGTGEYKAFNEFLEKNTHLKAKEIKGYNRKSKSFLILPNKNKENDRSKRN